MLIVIEVGVGQVIGKKQAVYRVTAADASLLFVAIAWGASYSVAKTALAYTTVLMLLVIRFSISSLLMGVFTCGDLRKINRSELCISILLGSILFSIFLCETYGVAFTSATNTALIISLCVIFTPFLEYGLRGALPPRGVSVGCLISIAGVWALTGGIQHFYLGDFLVLGAAILRAVIVVCTKNMLRSSAISSGALTTLQVMTVALLTAVVVALAPGQSFQLPTAPTFWVAVLFLIIICNIAAFFIQNHAIRKTTPTRVNLLMGTEPLWGFVFSFLFLNERASVGGIVGGFLIIVGLCLAIYSLSLESKEIA